jgi:putative ABC transport system substrate-binding protein
VGHNLDIEERYSDGNVERLPILAAELVRLKPDVIMALGTPATVAVRRETTTIPIVMAGGVDPVEAGLIASFARPGGNVTGALQDVGQQTLVKTLEMFKEVMPRSSRVTVLMGPHQVNVDALALLKPAATKLELTLHAVTVAGESNIKERLPRWREIVPMRLSRWRATRSSFTDGS